MFKKFANLSVACSVLGSMTAMTISPAQTLAASMPSSWAVEFVNEAKEIGLAAPELVGDYAATTTRLEFCRAAVNLLRKYGYAVDSVTPNVTSRHKSASNPVVARDRRRFWISFVA